MPTPSMSVYNGPAQPHPQHLESFGTHCSLSVCNVSDFLPFTCPYCTLPFCGAHRLPPSHSCTSAPAESLSRVAHSCPLCGEVLPSSSAVEDSADAAMEAHLDVGQCKAMQTDARGVLLSEAEQARCAQAKKEESRANTCAYARCRNKLWIDLKCDKCGKGFCPSHREARAHRCQSAEGQGRTPSPTNAVAAAAENRQQQQSSKSAGSGLLGKLKASGSSSGTGVEHGKSSIVTSKAELTPAPTSGPAAASTSGTGSGILNKLSVAAASAKEDRVVNKRAAAEERAALLSLRNRAEKGLLNDEGKVRLAKMEMEIGKKGGKLPSSMGGGAGKKGDKGCCIS